LIALGLALAAAIPARAQTTPALVDQDLTVGAGATLANAIGDLTASVQARYVPDRLFGERGAARRTANIGFRALRLLFVDVPQAQWLLVASHEVFGHGGRVREQFDGLLRFHVDLPWPYGRGGGVTVFGLDRDFTVHELQAVSVAGMEVNAVAAEQIAARSLVDGRLSPRAALRYLGFELDAFEYIQRTGDEPEAPGHDVSDFLELYNVLADATGADPLAPRTLRRHSWVSLANPMIASAVVAIGRHLATGETSGPVLAIPLWSARVMPAVRYRLTPWGPEWAASADVAWSDRSAQLVYRQGRALQQRPWGIGARYGRLTLQAWAIDVAAELWRQPPIALGAQPAFGLGLVGRDMQWGGEIRARAESQLLTLWLTGSPTTLIVDAGVKSVGFVAGEPLDRGFVLRAGLGLPLGRW
jgi:hypothetical protein